MQEPAPASIAISILDGNFEYVNEAKAFAKFAAERLCQIYPETEVTVTIVRNTSGPSRRPVVSFDLSVSDEMLNYLTDGVIEVCDRLGDEWANAGCPGIAA